MASWGITFSLPGPSADDVTIQRFKYVVHNPDGTLADPVSKDYPREAAATEEAILPDGVDVDLILTDVDASGNESPASSRTINTATVPDTEAPPAPGQVGVAQKRPIPDA